jgi:serine/threonine protein kinase
MRRFDNPNIIKLYGVYESENSLYLIQELLNEGHLHTRINSREAQFTMAEIR